MKILIISSEFPPHPGGIGNHAYNLARMLTEEGLKVKVLTEFRGNSIETEKTFDKGLSFTVVRVRRKRIMLFTYWQRIREVYKLLNTKEVQIVLASGKFSLWMAAVGKYLFPHHRYLAIIHGSEVNPAAFISRAFTHWSLRRFEQLIAVSHFTRDLIWKINAQLPVEVINNGFLLRHSGEASAAKLKGFPALITVGNVTYRKGQHNVIRALPLLQQTYPDVHYHIVGIPTEQAVFLQLAKELEVEGHVSFHGMVQDHALSRLLAGADIFMMLSEQLNNGDVEGFGIAVLEANAMGIPAIGTLHSGIADAIKEAYSGKLIHPKDQEAVKEAVAIILANYELYSANAQQWAKGFTWDKIGQQYLALMSIQTSKVSLS